MCAATGDIAEEHESIPALMVSYWCFGVDTSVGRRQHAIRPRSRDSSKRFSARPDSSVYIYIYTRIFARAPRALDSPMNHDFGPNPLQRTFGWCWQATCSAAHAILDTAHVQKHSHIDVSILTCQEENAKPKSAQDCIFCNERNTF